MATVKIEDRTHLTDPRVYNNHARGYAWDGIGLHHTGSRSETGDYNYLSRYHENPVSIQKLFTRKGVIIKVVAENKEAWSFGYSRFADRDNCNSFMLGYEICNAGDGREPFTEEQYVAVAQSIAYDCARYHIPDNMITSHKRVRDNYLAQYPMRSAAIKAALSRPVIRKLLSAAVNSRIPTGRLEARLEAIARKNDPLGWDWRKMWALVDQIRASWPADWGIPLWFVPGTRQLTT